MASCSARLELVGIGVRGVLHSILAVVSLVIQRGLAILEERFRVMEKGELKGLEGELATLKAQR